MSAVIEGRNAVTEALRSGARLTRVLVARGVKPHPALEEIRARCAEAGIPLAEVPRAELDRRSERGAHQGVLAEVAPFEYAELADIVAATSGRPAALVVCLDHVTELGNLGAAIRSVEVVGGAGVVIPRDRAAAVTPVTHKASAGATAHLPIAQVTNLPRALDELKAAGFWVVGADASARAMLWEAPIEGRIAIVAGAEGSGLSRLVRERCDLLVGLPVRGRVDSLNVAQAVTVLAYEWLRRSGTS